MDLAVVIVTWNVRDLVLQALESLLSDLADSGLSSTVYVVDNASTDGTAQAVAEQFPQVHLIASAENLGFGKGNNLAIRQALTEGASVMYLLNSDTITQRGATRTLYDVLQADPQVGLVGARLTYGDGGFQHSAFMFPGLRQLWTEFFPTPGRWIEGTFNGRYPRRLYESTEPFGVDFTLGATMMLKRTVVEQTGGFDEAFFMYAEEVDWAWRIRQAGWRALCVPSAHVIHLGGQSTSQVRPQSVIHLWTSRLRLFRKHYPAWKQVAARLMIVLGMTLKAARESDPLARAAYQTVRRLALRGE